MNEIDEYKQALAEYHRFLITSAGVIVLLAVAGLVWMMWVVR